MRVYPWEPGRERKVISLLLQSNSIHGKELEKGIALLKRKGKQTVSLGLTKRMAKTMGKPAKV